MYSRKQLDSIRQDLNNLWGTIYIHWTSCIINGGFNTDFVHCMCIFLNQQLYESLKESLAQAEALDYLEFHPEGGEQSATLLGLKPEHLLTGEHHKKSIHQVHVTSVCFLLFSFFVGLIILWSIIHIIFYLCSKSFQQNIIPELESRLRSKCETVASFHKPAKQAGKFNEVLY